MVERGSSNTGEFKDFPAEGQKEQGLWLPTPESDTQRESPVVPRNKKAEFAKWYLTWFVLLFLSGVGISLWLGSYVSELVLVSATLVAVFAISMLVTTTVDYITSDAQGRPLSGVNAWRKILDRIARRRRPQPAPRATPTHRSQTLGQSESTVDSLFQLGEEPSITG